MGAEKTPGSGGDSEGPRENDSHVRAWALLARFLDQHTLSDTDAVDRFVADHPPEERALREILRGFHTIRDDAKRTTTGDKGPEGPSENGHNGESAGALAELLRRIREDIGRGTRFTEGEQIGSGGIGVVYKLWDANLRRSVAKKTIRADKLRPDSAHRIQWIARFLEEAQITAQLDHPGVVPIHDIGFEPDGQIYFTMRFVRGDTLWEVIQKTRSAVDGWNRTRVVSALLRVCETIAYAHGKDVIHRDLKPANIMVGRYGETYVMDWGLARKLGNPDLRDLRIRPQTPHSTDVRTDARDVDDTGLFTLDGHAIGTPCYMAPEQAAGDLDRIGKPADIYSLGAILYEILAGNPPYQEPGVQAKAHTICRWVLEGPPAKLHARAPDAPPELIAICERAMARATSQRYDSVEAMAEDLRAYLENRVVKAHRTGPISELRKWVSRNRLAAGIAIALVATISTAGFLLSWSAQRRFSAEIARFDMDRYSSIRSRAEALLEEGARLSPVDPDCERRAHRWLRDVDELRAEREAVQSQMQKLLARPHEPVFDEELERRLLEAIALLENYEKRLSEAPAVLQSMEERTPSHLSDAKKSQQDLTYLPEQVLRQRALIRRLEIEYSAQSIGTQELETEGADSISSAFLRVTIPKTQRALDLLFDSECGMVLRVRSMIDNAKRIAEIEAAHRQAWLEAIRSIADPLECPRYAGLQLEPSRELIPLRRNDESGLWEFWHVASGSKPRFRTDGNPNIAPDTAIVFVLMPPDVVWMGFQNSEPSAHFYYPSTSDKIRRHAVRLNAFFAGKYEVTQSQWIRLADNNPSKYFVGFDSNVLRPLGSTNPVDSIDHSAAEKYLPLWKLDLLTDAQWLSCTGLDIHHKNLSPIPPWGGEHVPTCENLHYDPVYSEQWQLSIDPIDGYIGPSPVGSFPPNANGFHDLMGNMSEVCADYLSRGAHFEEDLIDSGTGARRVGASSERSVAGPSYATPTTWYGAPYRGVTSLRRGALDAECGLRVAINIHPRHEQNNPISIRKDTNR